MDESICVSVVIAGGQEEVKTLKLWEEQNPVSLAYNNILLKKMLEELRLSISRGN